MTGSGSHQTDRMSSYQLAELDIGPTPAAFTFRELFPAPDAPADALPERSELPGECPAL